MEKYIITRDQSSDTTNRVLSDIYRDVVFNRQITATRVENVRADTKKVEDAPVWRGDHTFSSDAAKYSFLNFIEPEVANKHPDWSKQKIRKEALTKFQQRLEQDLLYEQKESSHQETAVHWRVIETPTGTQELATEYGGETITLRQLWDHTREYAAFVGIPSAYNANEEKAQYAMEQAFIRGDAQAYISVLSHPDAVRYVQVWERDEDGGVLSKQIDLYKTTGRDFTQTEGDVLVKHLAAFTETAQGMPVVTTDAAYAHFIVRSGSVGEQDIRTIAIVQAATLRESSKTYAISDIKDKEIQVPLMAHKETQNTFLDIQLFVTEAINKKIAQLKEMATAQKVTEKIEKSIEPKLKLKTEKGPQSEKDFPLQDAVINHTQPEKLHIGEMDPVTDVLAELVITKTVLSLGSQFSEVSGGALYWLAILVEKKSLPSERIAKSETIREAMVSMMRSVRIFFEKRNETFTKIYGRSRRLVEYAVEPGVPSKLKDQEEIPQRAFGFFEQIALHMNESRPVAVFAMLKELAHLLHPKSTTNEEVDQPRDVGRPVALDVGKVILEKEASLVPVFFGIFYWVFLSYTVKSSFAHSGVVEIGARDAKNADEKHGTEDYGSDQPPWILLSIIWHLTMLREAAMVASAPQQTVMQSTQVTDSTAAPSSTVSVLPLTGVIFPSLFVLE